MESFALPYEGCVLLVPWSRVNEPVQWGWGAGSDNTWSL